MNKFKMNFLDIKNKLCMYVPPTFDTLCTLRANKFEFIAATMSAIGKRIPIEIKPDAIMFVGNRDKGQFNICIRCYAPPGDNQIDQGN